MPRYIPTDKEQYNLFVPLRLRDQIVEGSLAATIQYIVYHKIDISGFDQKIINDKTGRPAYNPRVLLKLILFSYSKGIISSRKIHDFAVHNIEAMAVCEIEKLEQNIDAFVHDDFSYDKEKDVVICPAGQKLPPSRGAVRKLLYFYHTSFSP